MSIDVKNYKEKVLVVGAVGSMIANFNMENIKILKSLGYDVEVAANFGEIDPISNEKREKMFSSFQSDEVVVHQIEFQRGMGSPLENLKVILQLRRLILEKRYKFIHTNSPLASALVRIANSHKKTKIIYTAHGFQFFKGGRKRDWLLFYPIERLLASRTDILLTINSEDYTRAKKMGFKKVEKIPGVGVDIQKFRFSSSDKVKNSKRILISVGELNKNKNHILVFDAIQRAPWKNSVEYWVCGIGEKFEEYKEYIETNKLTDTIKLLGYRIDISDLLSKADLFVFPSFREGLSVSVIEAMANGLPVLASNIRGNEDLIDEGKGGYLFDPKNSEDLVRSLDQMLSDSPKIMKYGKYNFEKSDQYDIKLVNNLMKKKYNQID